MSRMMGRAKSGEAHRQFMIQIIPHPQSNMVQDSVCYGLVWLPIEQVTGVY